MTATIITLPFRPPQVQPEVWTLSRAIVVTKANHWAGMRRLANAASHCKLLSMHLGWDKLLDDITNQDLLDYRDQRAEFVEPATVHANLAVVPVLYQEAKRHGYRGLVPVQPAVTVPKKLKWWLNPDQHEAVTQWLNQQTSSELLDYINWSCATGLRVEETLRVLRVHFVKLASTSPSLLVPGTKTAGSLRTVPLSQEAASLALRRFAQETGQNAPLFAMSYTSLWTQWSKLRSSLGLPDGSTPKALRRSFARALASKGAPLPVIQQLLGHSSLGTTMEYLRLTGGAFNDQEVRQWL